MPFNDFIFLNAKECVRRFNERIENIKANLLESLKSEEDANMVIVYMQECMETIYRRIPSYMFLGFYTDKNCVGIGHALPHSLDVIERVVEILKEEK